MVVNYNEIIRAFLHNITVRIRDQVCCIYLTYFLWVGTMLVVGWCVLELNDNDTGLTAFD